MTYIRYKGTCACTKRGSREFGFGEWKPCDWYITGSPSEGRDGTSIHIYCNCDKKGTVHVTDFISKRYCHVLTDRYCGTANINGSECTGSECGYDEEWLSAGCDL